MIKQSTIDKIIETVQINEVIGDHIKLKKVGSNYKALCPFHNEKTASFTVSPAKNMFNCFGCGVGGDSIKFLEKHKHFTFPETIKYLGDKYGIPIEETKPDPERDRIAKEKETIIEFNFFAAEFYQKQLINESLEYVQSRFSKESIEQWMIGFATANNNSLSKAAVKKGYSEKMLIESGLVRKSRRTDSLYDFFRNRIMFPVFDNSGRIISFSGRQFTANNLENNQYAKYLNLPGTPLYKKGKVLYGINFAIHQMSKYNEAILVEGNPDVIHMHEIGVTNTIAPSGTALTVEQINLIKRSAEKITILYDGDAAGQAATIKYCKLCIENGLSTYLAVIPEGEDPDTFFKNLDHFKTWYKENSIDFITFYSNKLLGKVGADPIKKNRAIVNISKLLFHLDQSTRSVYIDQITSRYKLKIKLFTNEIKDLEPVKSKNDNDVQLPDGVNQDEFNKWGFYDHEHQYYFQTKSGIVKVSNFTMKPVFHIKSLVESKRIYELTNYLNHSVMADFDMNEMTSLQPFQRHVEGLGNFLFLGSSSNFSKLKLKLYEETPTCKEIKNLGWQPFGFWAWSNGIVTDEGFKPVNENGVITFNDQNYFIPAFSKIYIGDGMLFKDERKFKYVDRNVTLSDWASLFIKVFGDNAIISISFWLAAIFRDHILHLFKNFPILNLFGPKGSGKSQLAMSLSCLFGEQQTPFNIHNGTKPGLAEHIQLFRNSIAWIDEYKNNIEYDKVETLKSIYDSIGRSRMNIDKGKKKETTDVNSAVILSGQEMPTADVALFSRTMFLRFMKSEFNDEEKSNYDDLKTMERDGLSHLTSSIVKHRVSFVADFYNEYTTVLSDLQSRFENRIIEDRILRNFASAVASFKTIHNYIQFPFSYEDLLDVSVPAIIAQNNQIQQSNEIGMFWNLLEAIFDENLITAGWEFRVDFEGKLKTKDRDVQIFPQGKYILKLKFNVIYSLYAKQSRSQGVKPLPSDTLQYYLKNHKYFLGVQNSCRFQITEFDQTEGKHIKRSQTTSAYCFDYLLLGINLERDNIDDDLSCINDHNNPDNQTGPASNTNPEDNLPF